MILCDITKISKGQSMTVFLQFLITLAFKVMNLHPYYLRNMTYFQVKQNIHAITKKVGFDFIHQELIGP